MNKIAKINDAKELKLWKQLENIADNVLKKAKAKGATSAEVSLSSSSGISTSVRLGKVDNLEYHSDKVLGITVYNGKHKGNVGISDLTEDSINSAIDAALKIAKYTEADPCNGLADPSLLAENIKDLQLNYPQNISSEKAIEIAKECEQYALDYDKRVTNSDGASFSESSKYSVYANSNGFFGAYPSTSFSTSCVVVATDKNEMQRDYDYSVARDYNNLLDIKTIGTNAASNTIKRLGAKKIKTCNVPVIFSSKLASGLIGSFMSAISGGSLYRNTSFLIDSIGKKVFPEFINIHEDPFELGGLGSACFDSEGVATQKKYFIEQGKVKSYVLGSYSARKLGLQSTGNAGGVHNLKVSNSNSDLDSLVKKMDKGLIVTELMGHGINLVTGDYSRGAFGFWVENGKIQYPVQEITIAGNLKEIFLNIVDISNDVETRSNIQTGSILVSDMKIAGN